MTEICNVCVIHVNSWALRRKENNMMMNVYVDGCTCMLHVFLPFMDPKKKRKMSVTQTAYETNGRYSHKKFLSLIVFICFKLFLYFF